MNTTERPLPTVTAGPFVESKGGKWCLIAERGGMVVHATTKDRATNYDIAGTLTEKALDDLLRSFAAEWVGLTVDGAREALLAHQKAKAS